MAKTLTFGIMHLGIAFSVTYALTGSLAVSGAVTFIEPAINTVAHYFFDKYWDKRDKRQHRQAPATRDSASAAAGNGADAGLVSA
ncbi:conserved exported hypothetical protein [Cupriavidus phytorum]|uniref:DUF2061 domain-containing protein n=2 Tax=Cupriavidus TaxID=106589 RepID=A0A375BCI4_9BURK|nr:MULTISPECIES: DUF2061 domain-containing protein [Cupriavidus]PZX30732.1 putative membrane protein [Cupriavidus alkaliphilus]SOY41445.1 conserved exported hypothetical protein [Cupriavidus taiwanensis]